MSDTVIVSFDTNVFDSSCSGNLIPGENECWFIINFEIRESEINNLNIRDFVEIEKPMLWVYRLEKSE